MNGESQESKSSEIYGLNDTCVTSKAHVKNVSSEAYGISDERGKSTANKAARSVLAIKSLVAGESDIIASRKADCLPELTIIEYNNCYRNECVDIFITNFSKPPFDYDWIDRDKIIRYFDDMTATPKFRGFIFLENGSLIGMCMGVLNDYYFNVTYEIKEIAIRRELQNSGRGCVALAKIEDLLRETGVAAISLSTNNDMPAFGFYLKNGYEVAPKAVMLIKGLQNV